MSSLKPRRATTLITFRSKKKRGERITMLTAYDATMARMVDDTGIDAILVGDSLGMVIQGHPNTLPVTLDDMIYHCRAVVRGTRFAHIVADMPFMSAQISVRDALLAAKRLMQEGKAHAIKLEGGIEMAETVSAITGAGIPVMAHVGLTPQHVHAMGGFKVQAKSEQAQDDLLRDAQALEEAGAYAVVIEGIPATLGARVTKALTIPTIGIGAGAHCDGQVLVLQDMLGMLPDFKPKFVKRYASLYEIAQEAISTFRDEVQDGSFPDDAHSFHTKANKGSHPTASSENMHVNGKASSDAIDEDSLAAPFPLKPSYGPDS